MSANALILLIIILLISNVILLIKYKMLYKKCEKYVIRYYQMKRNIFKGGKKMNIKLLSK